MPDKYEWLWNGVCLFTLVISVMNTSVILKNRDTILKFNRKLNGTDAQP